MRRLQRDLVMIVLRPDVLSAMTDKVLAGRVAKSDELCLQVAAAAVVTGQW